MSTPAELERIAKEVEEIEKAIIEAQKPKETPPAEPAEPGEKPPETPPPTEPPVEPPPTEPPVEPPKEEPPKEEPATPPPVKREETVDFWKHKYDVLKGKYDKEVPRYAAELRSANDRLINLESEVAKLKERPPEHTTSPKQDTIENHPKIQLMKEQFPDVYEAVQALMEAKVGDAAGKLQKLEQEVKVASATSQQTATERFYSELDSKVKDWETINYDPEFHTWLGQTDRYTGTTRKALIEASIKRLDGRTTAAFFEDFMKDRGTSSGQEPEPTPAPTLEPIPAKKPDVLPPKSRTTQTPPRKEEKIEIITTDQITKFYHDLQRGIYRGREAEAQKEEARIDKAVAEGRVRQS